MMFTRQDFHGISFDPQGMKNGEFPILSPGMFGLKIAMLPFKGLEQIGAGVVKDVC